MIVARVQISGVHAIAVEKQTITAGMIGAQVQLEYTDPLWDGLRKTVVFCGAGVKDIITDDTVVTIPAEVIKKAHVTLTVGVYGVDADGCIAIPTRTAELGIVRCGTNPSGDTTTDTTLPVWAKIQSMIGNLSDLDATVKNNLVAAVNEALAKAGDVDTETVKRIVEDTVPAWAKQPQKPEYTAAEVGALPNTYTPPNQTAQQVGADPAGTASTAVSKHNADTAAHNDMRIALQALAARVNAVLDSDDVTLDQMSEVVAYIKSNKSLIDAITTSKVSVDDIVNDLVTNVADKPLSAAQGVALKGLIEELRTLIPDEYTLPTATETTLGGVKPVTATDAMTQPVGVTADGQLVTKPGEGCSGIAVTGATVGQTVKIAAVDNDGVPTAWVPADFPSGGMTNDTPHYETIYEGVWDQNQEIHIVGYDEETGYYEVQDGELSEFAVDATTQCMCVPEDTLTDVNQLIVGDQRIPNSFKKIDETHISIALQQSDTTDYTKFHLETLGVPNFVNIDSSKIRFTQYGKSRTHISQRINLSFDGSYALNVPFITYDQYWMLSGYQQTEFEYLSALEKIVLTHSESITAILQSKKLTYNTSYASKPLNSAVGIVPGDGKIQKFIESPNGYNSVHTIANGNYIRLERWVE